VNNPTASRRVLKAYFEAASLANFNPCRFVSLIKTVRSRHLILHFFLVSGMLFVPLMHAIARLDPYTLFSRLYGGDFSEITADALTSEDFNQLAYTSHYGKTVILPLLGAVFLLLLILQIVFYLGAAFFLGLRRALDSSDFSFRERAGVFIMASTLPSIGSAFFGLWMPTVHIIVFYLTVILLGFTFSSCEKKEENKKEKIMYDFGAVYAKEKTVFKVWAQNVDLIEVHLYKTGDVKDNIPIKTVPMRSIDQDVWRAEINGDIKNCFYVYAVTRKGKTQFAVDPYAKAGGVNGFRGMIIDMRETDPAGFRDIYPQKYEFPKDAIIYELHVRDFSMHPSSGITNKHRGKYLAFTETGTKNAEGLPTGIDHLKMLGVTHVHLLPVFDFKTVDEEKSLIPILNAKGQFNWGYDPQNYNVPEGSYASDPFDGVTRIREFKRMVQSLHEAGLSVVMDVVYNHTFSAIHSHFEILAPGYYYRSNPDGSFSNGSGCGNETASEREMMRKYMIDSVVYWAEEYRIDGFRFDLMALHDIDTMNGIRDALDEVNPEIILYGEGWTAGPSPLPDSQKSLKENVSALNQRIAVFSDDIRDGIKGSVFVLSDTGFVNSNTGARREDVKFGIAGGVEHSAIDINQAHYSKKFWASSPLQSISYISSHDNLTLWDKLERSTPADRNELIAMNKLAGAIMLTSQGIPFFQAGEEIARTKSGDDNSYQSADSINMLDWDRKTEFLDLYEYYRGLIALRKKFSGFRLNNADAVRKRIHFLDTENTVIAYTLENPEGPYQRFTLIFNGSPEETQVRLDSSDWDVLVNHERAGPEAFARITSDSALLPGKSALILGK
jgi:pullulanase